MIWQCGAHAVPRTPFVSFDAPSRSSERNWRSEWSVLVTTGPLRTLYDIPSLISALSPLMAFVESR